MCFDGKASTLVPVDSASSSQGLTLPLLALSNAKHLVLLLQFSVPLGTLGYASRGPTSRLGRCEGWN